MPTSKAWIHSAIGTALFKNRSEHLRVTTRIAAIIDLLKSGKTSVATDEVIEFLATLWQEFSVTSHGEMFLDFAKIEMALYGLELTEEGGRYRDHLIHLFNVFVTGLLIFSEMMNKDESLAFECMKIRPEYSKMPFPIRYKSPRRLYHLWALVSTLHDIALPVEHLRKVTEGLREFYNHFDISTPELEIRFPQMSTVKAGRYFTITDRMFSSGVILENNLEKPSYRLENKSSSPYFTRTMFDLFESRNHGVVASYFLFDSIERTFLRKHHEKLLYDLDVVSLKYRKDSIQMPFDKSKWASFLKLRIPKKSWNGPEVARSYDPEREQSTIYTQYVFEQDITRASLAIALHSINSGEHPKLFPIPLSKLPITWFLILLDETQEYFRPEGLWLHSVTKFQDFPRVSVKKIRATKSFEIVMTLNFRRPSVSDEQMMVGKFNLWKGREVDVRNYEELVAQTWKGVFRRLRDKLSFARSDSVAVKIRVTVAGRPPRKEPLEFVSNNWRS